MIQDDLILLDVLSKIILMDLFLFPKVVNLRFFHIFQECMNTVAFMSSNTIPTRGPCYCKGCVEGQESGYPRGAFCTCPESPGSNSHIDSNKWIQLNINKTCFCGREHKTFMCWSVLHLFWLRWIKYLHCVCVSLRHIKATDRVWQIYKLISLLCSACSFKCISGMRYWWHLASIMRATK